MSTPCPQCTLENTYPDGNQMVCADCGFEWSAPAAAAGEEAAIVIKDANGNVLSDGDNVVLIKDLKVKGSSSVLKMGTKVKNIRLVPENGDHDIDCKVDGSSMYLKSSVVRKG